jgi:single-stranded-DNA-specific exonuclease
VHHHRRERFTDDSFLVLDLEDAHEGITGIVAGKLKDRYYRPVIIVTPTADGNLKGTGRSIDGINIYDMLKNNEELFLRFGGHAAACGFTMDRNNLEALRRNLNEAADFIRSSSPEIFDRDISAEMELDPWDINYDLVDQLELLEPCGCANMRPLAAIRAIPDNIGRMGNQSQYMRFAAVMDDGSRLPCVVFHDVESIDAEFQNMKKNRFSIIGNLNSRTWNGNRSIQMTVEHVESV